jgi:hypothetical protein
VQWYGGARDKGRDVVAYKHAATKRDKWYIQCKRYQAITFSTLRDELDRLAEHTKDQPDFAPDVIVFATACPVPPQAKDQATGHARALNLPEPYYWGRLELDERLKTQPQTEAEFFGWYGRPIGIPFQTPTVPRYFVPRPEVSQALMDYLTADAPPGALVVSAVHGLGGIGKTTLVAALAHDPDVQTRFPDGVLWATLGQQPDVLSLLAGWIQALGDYDFHPTVIEMASAHLRTLLHDKACLLVVDDAWQADHARPFLGGGPCCRLIVTTRNPTLARKVGARLYDLDVMTEAQALALFQARLGPLNSDHEQAAALAHELGYLPLALELAAAQVEAGLSWTELLDAFRQAQADLAVLDLDEATYRNESLRLSFRLSLEQLLLDDRDAFAWLGVLLGDAHLNPVMVATLWNQPEAEACKRLRRLRDRALLKQVGHDRYTLHDLLHDEAKLRLAERMPLPEAHAALLERYKQKVPGKQWHRLPDDGYLHEHLTWHMEQARQIEAIHALLREETGEGRNAWYEAREALGQTVGYLDDVSRAWRLANSEVLLPQGSERIGRGVRYALITTSLNSLAKNIPSAVLIALVEKSMWTLARGLTYARQVPDLKQRAEALAGLAAHLPEAKCAEVLGEALAAAQAIRDMGDRTEALAELAPHLPEAERAKVLGEALAAAQATDNVLFEAVALAELAPHLPEALSREALAAARALTGSDLSWGSPPALALARLVPRLAELGYPEEALAAARALPESSLMGPSRKAEALVELAPHFSEPLLREALTVARALPESDLMGLSPRALALARLVPRLAELGHPEEALAAARALPEGGWPGRSPKADALAGLALHLPEALLREALAAVQAIECEFARAEALAGLAPHLLEPQRGEALLEALATALAVGDEEWRAEALAGLAPYLPEAERAEALKEALAAARAIRNEYRRVEALAVIAPHLPELLRTQVLQEALAAARAIESEDDLARALAVLVSHLPAALLKEVPGAVLVIRDTDEQAHARARLAPRLAELGRPHEALAEAQMIERENYRAKALVGLTPYLPEAESNEVVEEALAWTRAIRGEDDRAEALAVLAPYLPEPSKSEALLEALEAARALPEGGWPGRSPRAEALARLAPHLPEALLREALEAARAIKHADARALALAELIPYLRELLKGEILQLALAAARDIGNETTRAEALARLAPHLPEALLREALAATQAIEWEWARVQALAGLAPHLSEALLREALAAARAIENEYRRVEALAVIVPYLPELLRTQTLQEALAVTRAIEHADVQTVTLARLAPHLPEALLREALAAASAAKRQELRAEVLAELLSHLPESLKREALREALAAARAIGDEEWRTKVLIRLALHLPEAERAEILSEALEAARALPESDWLGRSPRVEALVRLALHLTQLPRQDLYPLWQETLPILAARTRKDLLADLCALEPVIATLGGVEAVAETFRAIRDVGRWWP